MKLSPEGFPMGIRNSDRAFHWPPPINACTQCRATLIILHACTGPSKHSSCVVYVVAYSFFFFTLASTKTIPKLLLLLLPTKRATRRTREQGTKTSGAETKKKNNVNAALNALFRCQLEAFRFRCRCRNIVKRRCESHSKVVGKNLKYPWGMSD